MVSAQLLELRYHDPQSALGVDLEEIERIGADTFEGESYRWRAVLSYAAVSHFDIALTLASTGKMCRLGTPSAIYFLENLIPINLPSTLMSNLVTQAMDNFDRSNDIFRQYHEYGCLRAIELHAAEMGKDSPEAAVLMTELMTLPLLNRRHLIIQWKINQLWGFDRLGKPAVPFFKRVYFGLKTVFNPYETEIIALRESKEFLRLNDNYSDDQ